LFDAYEDYSCFGEVGIFRHVEGFKKKQKAEVKFFVKLKKCLKCWEVHTVKNVYRERVFEWHKRFREGLQK
jgi:hypothetical protein